MYQIDCPPPNGLNHYLSLNKTGAHSTGERFSSRFRAIMALLISNTSQDPLKDHKAAKPAYNGVSLAGR